MSISELGRRMYYLLNRSRLERELAEEMAAHREMQSAQAAPFGNALRLREESRDVWGWGWWDRLVQDLTFGSRLLRKSPVFTLTAVAILALGVGLNIAGFQIFNMMVLKPIPVRDPDTIFRFYRKGPQATSSNMSYPALDFYRRHSTAFSAVMGVTNDRMTVEDDQNIHVPIQFVTANYLIELGATPAYGRLLDASHDEAPGAEPVVVLEYGFWESRFGANPNLVGKTIRLNGRPFTVAGVAPRDFTGLEVGKTAAWIPITQHPYAFPGSTVLSSHAQSPMQFFGRLKPGVSPRDAEDRSRPLAAALREQQPEHVWKDEWLMSRPAGYLGQVNEKTAPVLSLISVFCLLLLMASCASLGNLMLARAAAREQEISVRASLGAGRARLVRQLLTESLLLGLLGTAAGLLLSVWAAKALLVITDAPRFLNPGVDYRVLLFALLMATLATMFFGLTPALQALRPQKSKTRARNVLVTCQVAAGCLFLVVASLFLRGLERALNLSPGFEYQQVITIDPGLSANGFEPAAALAYWNQMAARVQQVSGVERVAIVSLPPLGNFRSTSRLPNGYESVNYEIEPDYFAALSIPLLRGRNFRPGERDVAIVSESLARIVWPGEDPLGKAYRQKTVVGVVGNARTVTLSDPATVEVYFPIEPRTLAQSVMVVRVRANPESMVDSLVPVARSIDPRVSTAVTAVKDSYAARLQDPRRAAMILLALGVTALALAAVGLAGLVSFTVTQRTREIGIRMALGARSGHVLTTILRQFRWPVLTGLGLGMAGAALLSMALRGELYGLSNLDPISYAVAAVLFVAVVALSALGPARRALKVDPMIALRYE